MNTLLYLLAGFAIGFEAGKYASGVKYNWKRSLIAVVIAFGIAIVATSLTN